MATFFHNRHVSLISAALSSLLLLAAMFSATLAHASAKTESDPDICHKSEKMSLLELKQLADSTYYRTDRRLDAEPVYRTLLARGATPLSDEEEKLMAAAYSNYATLLIFERNNPVQAYPMLKRALDIAGKYRDSGFSLIGAYTNMSHIYANFNDTVKAIGYLKEGFRNALGSSAPERAGYIYAQMLLMAWDFNRIDDVGDEMDTFVSDPRLRKGRLYRYNLELTSALSDFRHGRFADASARLKNAATTIDAEYDPEIYTSMTLLMAAEAAIRQKDAQEAGELIARAADNLKGFEELNGRNFLNKVMAEYYLLSGRPDKAEECRIRSLVMRDSLYSARNMTVISDLEQDLITSKYNTELKEAELRQDVLREKNARQRSLMIVMGISSAIVITLLLFLIYKRRKLTECRHDLFLRNVDLVKMERNEGNAVVPASDPEPPASNNRDCEEESLIASTFRKVKDFIDSRKEVFDPGFSIDTMSDMSGIPVRLISKSVNRHAGKNFSLFLADRRIREACRILLANESGTRPTIEAVAEEVGYKSRSHFSRVFKSVTGLTTTEFIRQARRLEQ